MPKPKVPDSARDPNTPDEVIIRMAPVEPYPDPTLGVPVPPTVHEGRPVNPLVTIGDSLTHGFQSGAIYNTRHAWPRIVAWEMGIDERFRYPTYEGHGGLPFNLEYIVRKLERAFGEKIDWWEMPLALFEARHLMSQIEDWWERGPGAAIPVTKEILHNLAVYGWDLRNALSWTAPELAKSIGKAKDDVLHQIVEDANLRAAQRVYASASDANGKALTVFQAAAELGKQGAVIQGQDGGDEHDPNGAGVETLAVLLGANNALGTVLSLKVNWSKEGYDDLHHKWKARFTIWRPSHFAAELEKVVAEVKKIRARHVVFGNVPHVTIAPVARGVARKVREDSRYFPFYTRPWISDEKFNPKDDPHLTEQQARAIDSAIDQFNESIADAVRAARKAGLDWYLLDVCGILDRLAQRRYIESPQARPEWWTPYELPPELAMLRPIPTTRFFTSDREGRKDGGLFSLDGVHPTTIGYGIIAQEFIKVLELAGVPLFFADNRTRRPGPIRVDFQRLIGLDTLVASPPMSLDSNKRLIGWFDETFDCFRRILPFV